MCGFPSKKPVRSLIAYFSENVRSLLHPNTAQRSPFALFVDALGKHPLCHRMCKVTKETSGANNIMRNAIDSTSITFRWTSSRSRQSVFSTTTVAKKTGENGSQSRKSDYLVKIGPWTSEPLLG